jgi:DNA polymerase III delta' subunit
MHDKLSGFDKIKKSLLDNFNDNKLHHGLLFSGNKGVGKSGFAFDLATKIILSSSANQSDDLKKVQSNSHPDLLIIQKEEKKRDITVDAVREITQFLSLTAAISKHRVIIIDAIDDLNRNSNNAILKTLEEPPANVFLFLINHNQAKVLDTIKSRCRLIKIPNPSYEDFKEILKKNIEEISEDEIKILAKISDHSVGSALDMYNYNAIDLYEQIEQLIVENNNKTVSAKEIFDLAKTISGSEELWNVFEKLIIFYFYNSLSMRHSNSYRYPGESRDPSREKMGPDFRRDDDVGRAFTTIDKINNLFSATKNLNLDKSQSILNIFNIIKTNNEK